MSRVDGLRHRLYVLFRGEAYADEVRRELRFHRELEALSRSSPALGNETYYREEVRHMTLMTWLDRVRQDATYALRGLRRSTGFTAAVVLTLGLGVGVNGAMFSLLSRLFIVAPDGVVNPGQIRRLYATFTNRPGERITIPSLQYPQYAALRRSVDSAIAIAIFHGPDSTAVRDGNARIPTMVDFVSPEFFSVLGVRARRGRLFTTDEAPVETPTPVAVLSDAYWKRAFNADPSAVGRQVKIDRRVVTIVGVAAPGFTGIDVNATDLWLPVNTYESGSGYNGIPWYRGFGAGFQMIMRARKPGDESQVLGAGTNAIRPVRIRGWVYDSTIALEKGSIIAALGPGRTSTDMVVANRIAGVVLLVLIIAGANIMNLLLLRTARRRREIAVRRALGVSRARLFEQITVEAVFLAIGGAGVALLFAFWSGVALRRLILPQVHWAVGVIDARTAVFIVGTSCVVAILSGVAPAIEAMRTNLTDSLKSGSQQGGHRGSHLRAALLAIQTALCVVLLVGAGLFLRSLQNVASIGLGFDVENRLIFSTAFDDPAAHTSELQTAIPEAADRLRHVDGVLGAAYMDHAPVGGYTFRTLILPGHDKLPQLVGGEGGPAMASISSGYFDAVGVRLIAGRDFAAADSRDGLRVTIVSERLAKLYWPGENPIGKCLLLANADGPCTQVVGVSGDTHRSSLIERPTTQLYLPIAQTTDVPRQIVVHVQAGRETAVARAADEILRSLVTDLVSTRSRRFADVTQRELRPWSLGATLFTSLGVLALCVAAVGVYSVVAYGVSQRVHEMGVRVALGARRSNIVDLVLSDGIRAVCVGIAIGIVASVLLGRFVASLLFGVEPRDAGVLITSGVVLVLVGSAACLLPAWRASNVNPVDALRAD